MIAKYALDDGYDAIKIDFTQIGPDGTHLPKSEVRGHSVQNLHEDGRGSYESSP